MAITPEWLVHQADHPLQMLRFIKHLTAEPIGQHPAQIQGQGQQLDPEDRTLPGEQRGRGKLERAARAALFYGG